MNPTLIRPFKKMFVPKNTIKILTSISILMICGIEDSEKCSVTQS